MRCEYLTEGVCSRSISFDVEEGIIKNLEFLGGCSGNAKGIAALAEGQLVADILPKLKGITCGKKQSSCPDQLSKALEALQKNRCQQLHRHSINKLFLFI